AVDTNRFRYEGFAHSSSTRETEDSALGSQNAKRHNERVEKLHLSEKQAEGNHEAEHILPKHARALPDVKYIIDNQRAGSQELIHGQSYAPGAQILEAYSLAKP